MSSLRISDYPVSLADDVRLSVRHLRQQHGTASPPLTLLLLHESLGSIALWKRFPEQLAEATGLDVLLYERRGYGGSTPAPMPRPDNYLEEEGAIWLPRLIEALGLERLVLLGHSDGGSIALITAAVAPSRVSGLITIAAHVSADPLTLKGIREAQERYRTTDLPERLARYHGSNTDTLFNAWTRTWLRASFNESLDLRRWLGSIVCPALILQGEDDEYGMTEQVTTIAEGIGARATPVFMPQAGHSPHLQRPEAVLELVSGFIDREL